MKWEMKEARPGDIVRVSLGRIFHFGIFVSEDEIIQFGLPPTPNRRSEDVEVLSSPVTDFLAGGFLEVGCPDKHEKKKMRKPSEIVRIARSRLGERGYDIIHNNCEHFANDCIFGEKFSTMTEGLREKFRSIPVVHVYVSAVPFPVDNGEIYPAERAEEIENCSNEGVRSAKFYVWKLLEKALTRSFGLNLKDLKLLRTQNGKWECPECCFSLSHSGSLAAVALSRKPVGVDIEKCDLSRFTQAVADRITTAKERGGTGCQGAALNALWTKKEAVFKMLGDRAFVPSQIEVASYSTATRAVDCADGQYFVTVASEDAAQAIFRGAEGIEFSSLKV